MKTSDSFKPKPQKLQRIVTAIALILLPLVYFLPVFIWKLTLVPGDGLSQNLGVRVLIGQMIANGQAPLWNPYIFAGTPLLASIYPGALYPPNWVFALFSATTAMNIVVITTYHLALIGTYLYARRIGATRIGAMLAGLAFTFGGYLIAHAGHTSRIAAAIWLPWILLAIENLYLRFSWRWVALGAAFIALQLFAGEPQMNFYTILVCGAYAVFSFSARQPVETRWRFLVGLAVMCACGLLLSMAQLLPERELLGMGERSEISYEYFSGYSFPPNHILTFIFPFFFGGGTIAPYRIPYWGTSTLDEACGYFGLITLLLALAAVFGNRLANRQRALVWFWFGAAAVSLTLSFGGYLPFGLNHVLHRTPVYNLFRASGRHMYEFTFSLGLLAGLGASLLSQIDREAARRVFNRAASVFVAIVATTAIVYGFFSPKLTGISERTPGFDSLKNLEVWLPLTLALLSVAAVWLFVRRQNNFGGVLLVTMLFVDLMVFTVSFNYGWREFLSNVDQRLKDPPTVQFIKSRESDLNSFRVASYGALLDTRNYDNLNFPNVSIARGLQSVNGYDALRLIKHGAISGDMGSDGVIGDPNVIGREHQGFNLQNVKYLLIPQPEPTRPDQLIELDGVKFNRIETYQSLSPGKRVEATTDNAPATELALETLMSHSTHVPDNATVLKIKLHTKDGRVIEQELQAGRDTAEWAYDSPDVRAAIKHRRPKVAESFTDKGFSANRFLARLPFERAEIERIEFDYALPDADLLLIRASLFDAQTGASFPINKLDFFADRWKKLTTLDGINIYENRQVRPRAWFVKRLVAESSKDVLAAIKTGKLSNNSEFNPAETALLEKEDFGARPVTLPEIGDTANSEVKVTSYQPNRIELQTRNPQAGFMVLSEVYYRGWEAWLDGKRVPVEKVNYILRGVTVPAGDHRVEFVFRAHSFRNGLAYSLLGVLALIAGAVAARIKPNWPFNNGGWLEKLTNKAQGLSRSQVTLSIMLFLLAIYAAVLVKHASYGVGGADSSGYANIARSLLKGPIAQPMTGLDKFELGNEYAGFFAPLGYAPTFKDNQLSRTMVPIYAVGFPLHIAAAALLFGWSKGPFLVNPLLGVLSLVLLYLIARQLQLSQLLAGAACLLLAANPTFLYMTLQPMSDVPALFWGLALIFAGLKTRQNERWALLAGAAFGIAFLARPINILLLAPLAFCLPLKTKPLFLFGLGGAPFAAVFGAYNLAAYGNALQTGYGVFNTDQLITTHGVGDRFSFYARWLTLTLSPLLLLGWAGVAVIRSIEWRIRAMLIAWFGSFVLFYVGYDVYGAWWYTRFVLVGYPGLLLGAMLVARELNRLSIASAEQQTSLRSKSGTILKIVPHVQQMVARAAVAILLATPLAFELYHSHQFEVLRIYKGASVQAKSCLWADQRLPANALVLAMEMSGALKFYTQRLVVRWDYSTAEMWPHLNEQVEKHGYQFYAMLMPHELDKAKQAIAGKWTELGRLSEISLWQIDSADK